MGIWVNSVKEFCQNIHHVILICRWHLPSSCNRDFFARIFPACPIVLGTTMQSLKSWCFHGASSDVFRGVNRKSKGKNDSLFSLIMSGKKAGQPMSEMMQKSETKITMLKGHWTSEFNSKWQPKSKSRNNLEMP